MALCLKDTILTLFHPGNTLFQIMIVNSDVLLVPNMSDPLAIFRNWCLTSQVYASSAVLQMNKDIQKIWRYAALQWHNVTTKHPENQGIISRSVVDGKTTV
jgi:hypothetical protein